MSQRLIVCSLKKNTVLIFRMMRKREESRYMRIAILSNGNANYSTKRLVQVAKAREIVGQPIVDSITGKDLDASLAGAQTSYQAFLDDEK